MKYNEALKIDNRKYIEYYISLLKRKYMIIFTFYTSNDYNSRCIKISLFFFSFALNFTVNTLFFDDATMHTIYIDEGKYNFIFQIPLILYSTIISSLINIVIKFFSLTEKDIIQFKNKTKVKFNNIKKCIKVKMSLFFF